MYRQARYGNYLVFNGRNRPGVCSAYQELYVKVSALHATDGVHVWARFQPTQEFINSLDLRIVKTNRLWFVFRTFRSSCWHAFLRFACDGLYSIAHALGRIKPIACK